MRHWQVLADTVTLTLHDDVTIFAGVVSPNGDNEASNAKSIKQQKSFPITPKGAKPRVAMVTRAASTASPTKTSQSLTGSMTSLRVNGSDKSAAANSVLESG